MNCAAFSLNRFGRVLPTMILILSDVVMRRVFSHTPSTRRTPRGIAADRAAPARMRTSHDFDVAGRRVRLDFPAHFETVAATGGVLAARPPVPAEPGRGRGDPRVKAR